MPRPGDLLYTVQLLGPHTGEQVFYYLGLCKMRLSEGQSGILAKIKPLLDEAVSYFEQARQRNPDNPAYLQAIQEAQAIYRNKEEWHRQMDEHLRRMDKKLAGLDGLLGSQKILYSMEQSHRVYQEIERHKQAAHDAQQHYNQALIYGESAARRGDLENAHRYAEQAKKYAARYKEARQAQQKAEESRRE